MSHVSDASIPLKDANSVAPQTLFSGNQHLISLIDSSSSSKSCMRASMLSIVDSRTVDVTEPHTPQSLPFLHADVNVSSTQKQGASIVYPNGPIDALIAKFK